MLAAVMTAGVCCFVAPAAHGASRTAVSRPLVALLRDHVARTAPSATAPRVETVAARRPLTRVRTVLPVLEHAAASDGRPWVRVALPGRPNGHTGWIPTDHTRRSSTDWKIAVDLSARSATVSFDGLVQRRFRVAVGERATPTPRGRFFVEEALALSARSSGGPFALATSARSDVLQEFAGGPGQIALHGTNGLAGALGTAVSHGCIRLSPNAITWLARRIGAGTPLVIDR